MLLLIVTELSQFASEKFGSLDKTVINILQQIDIDFQEMAVSAAWKK